MLNCCYKIKYESIYVIFKIKDELIRQGHLTVPYKGSMDCFARVYKEGGLQTFWKGNLINCIRYFPTQALNFAFKDHFKKLFPTKASDSFAKKFIYNILSGSVAGAVSLAYVTTLFVDDF